jgi:hypothetical protein
MDEVVTVMTQEKFKGKLLIILAGYDREMNDLLRVNTGLASRFADEVIFKNLTPEQCLRVLEGALKKNRVRVDTLDDASSATRDRVLTLIKQLAVLPGWGNARDMQTLSKAIVSVAYTSTITPQGPENVLIVTPSDAIDCMEQMLDDRVTRSNVPILPRLPKKEKGPPPMASDIGSGPPPAAGAGSGASAGPPAPPAPPADPSASDKPASPKPPPAKPPQPPHSLAPSPSSTSAHSTNSSATRGRQPKAKNARATQQPSSNSGMPPTPGPSQARRGYPQPPMPMRSPQQSFRPPRQPSTKAPPSTGRDVGSASVRHTTGGGTTAEGECG